MHESTKNTQYQGNAKPEAGQVLTDEMENHGGAGMGWGYSDDTEQEIKRACAHSIHIHVCTCPHSIHTLCAQGTQIRAHTSTYTAHVHSKHMHTAHTQITDTYAQMHP